MLDFATRSGTALVAGGTGGIGSAVCRTLAARGSSVVFTYRSNHKAAEALCTDLRASGVKAEAVRVDLNDSDVCAGVAHDIVDAYGGIHTLVYAAGPHVPMIHLSRVSPAQFRQQIDTDVLGFFNLVHPILPILREAGGNIVAVTTAATRRFPVRDGLSSVPKGAVESLVKALAAEEGRFGIRANCVGPGMLTDGMATRLIDSGELDERALSVARSNIPLRRFGVAQDIAEAVAFLASDRAGFISGQTLDIDGGYGV
jgi:NAD(P)-dependent dehydrogenase (short-subunit alcohol dehydrogenase family)